MLAALGMWEACDFGFLSLVAERPPKVAVGFNPSAAAKPSRQTISSRRVCESFIKQTLSEEAVGARLCWSG